MDPGGSPVTRPGQAWTPACLFGGRVLFWIFGSAPRTAPAADRAGRLPRRHDARNPGGGGARSRAAAPRDPGNWSSTRARVPLCTAPGPAAPQDRGARNPGQPVSAGGATPVPASRPLCSSLLDPGAALPATRCLESGPWRRGWGGGGGDVTLFSPLTKCGVPQDPWPFVRFSRRVQISWVGVKRPQGSFRPQSWVASRKLADPLPFFTFRGPGRSLPDTLTGRGGCPELY